jgi:hypothetical protein
MPSSEIRTEEKHEGHRTQSGFIGKDGTIFFGNSIGCSVPLLGVLSIKKY